MATFNGSLNSNEFYNSLFNMIHLSYIYADNLSGLDSLADKYKTDGGTYHDQSVYTDMDVLYSRVWDPSDTNVLAPEAVVKPVQQKITVNRFRQIGIYTDEYLSKRAWMDEGKYDEFRSVVQKQVSETKKLFEQRLIDVFIGTVGNRSNNMFKTLTLPTDDNAEAQNRLQAQFIARNIGDLLVDLKDSTDKYNVNRFIKSFDESDIDVIWNSKYYNQILYTDLPTIFHKEDLLKKGHVLPERYFGDFATGTADGSTVRAANEYFVPVSGNDFSATGTSVKHVFPGDILPSGTPVNVQTGLETFTNVTTTINGVSRTVKAVVTNAAAYKPFSDKEVICKLIHKDAIKYLSSFETGSEFWNPKNLTTNRYITWAYADPTALDGYPIITITASTAG